MIIKFTKSIALSALLASLALVEPASGQDSSQNLGQLASDPLANMISVPLQFSSNFNTGPDKKTQGVMSIQPVIPFNLPNDWLLVTRTVLPVIKNPSDSISDSTFGIGDLSLTGWVVAPPSVTGLPPALTIGFGPTVQLPTHSDPTLGFKKVGLGPSAVAVYTKGKWLVGGLASNTWSIGDGGDQFNVLLVEPFATYTLQNDWYLISDLTITADWNASSSDRWTVPVGGGVGKTFNIGKQAVNTSLQVYKNVARPTGAADWFAQFTFQFLFPE